MITTGDILGRLHAACAADSALVACAQRLFGTGAVLTLQLGGDPMHEITAQDCPLVGFLQGGKSETGDGSPKWSWPLEIQVVICDERTVVADSSPAGVSIRIVSGTVNLDILTAAVRKACLDALAALGLACSSVTTEQEPPAAGIWPRQRAVLSLTVDFENSLAGDINLPATEAPDAE